MLPVVSSLAVFKRKKLPSLYRDIQNSLWPVLTESKIKPPARTASESQLLADATTSNLPNRPSVVPHRWRKRTFGVSALPTPATGTTPASSRLRRQRQLWPKSSHRATPLRASAVGTELTYAAYTWPTPWNIKHPSLDFIVQKFDMER